MEPIRTLIVDDHAAFRDGLRALLAAAPDIEVVDEAATGEQAVALAAAAHPDVVLLDLTMPGMGGIATTERLLAAMPHIRVLILSMADDDDSIFAAMRAGARGYVLKGARKAELLRAIRAVAAGEAIFGAPLAVRLMGFFAGLDRRQEAFPELSDRERQVLTLVAQHLTNPQIAERLALSQKTVRNHVSSIFTKLRVADRAQAIMRAREAGL
ncbi:response regulator [Paractinoplanes rishiriensis]|uniref:DNA-binding response regulator n=1 Tax=Paractinoplanes rishiriensis TaxID=1050105 RepID=A0A919MZW1_9ACTN|nr:response regulator transcription factor [Actinoplanes rishiriensis]GIF02039.1 DNA-binding response regulator [Actinoplanes rishiriensis]